MPSFNPRAFLNTSREELAKRDVSARTKDNSSVYINPDNQWSQLQASRCMDCGVPFCNSSCPLHNDIPAWNKAMASGDLTNAIKLLHATNNFPEFTGAICPAPCENGCVLTINDKPVQIRSTEYEIADSAFQDDLIKPEPPKHESGKRVAIVGSGPAGLATGQQLRRLGHRVVIYESADKPGGLLTYGIPDFKLEKHIVNRRLNQLREEGIEFVCNTKIGSSISLADLRSEFDAVVLATGFQKHRVLPEVAIGERTPLAMEYLIDHNNYVASQTPLRFNAFGKDVLVIGGGDTGADCVGVAHRQGAKSVITITHGPQPPTGPANMNWPNVPKILHTWPSHEEGGQRLFCLEVSHLDTTDDRLRASLKNKESNETTTYEFDLIVTAVGFVGSNSWDEIENLHICEGDGPLNGGNGVVHSQPDLFVTGDAREGASLIVTAIADGRRCAQYVQRYLSNL